MFSWTRSLYAICVCVQFIIFSVPCRETNVYYLMCGPHLICLYSFFASLITRAKIALVSVLWMFFSQPILKGFGSPFSTLRRTYKMAQTLKKPHTKALSPYVTTEPCNNTGNCSSPITNDWDILLLSFPLLQTLMMTQNNGLNCPGRRWGGEL